MAQLTNKTFAEEVKSDRLKVLIWITVGMSLTVLVILLSLGAFFTQLPGVSAQNLVVAASLLTIIVGGLVSNQLRMRVSFQSGTWGFLLSALFGLGLLLLIDSDLILQVMPFAFPLIVFIGGLLLSPGSGITLTTLAALVVFGMPMLSRGTYSMQPHQLIALLMTILAAGLAAQVTGELYQITQWALDHYQKERRTSDALFEKREELQRSLKRSEALSAELQKTNRKLEIARAEAEEAKHFRGQFLANMSHELRTPLNAVIGLSETMLDFPIMYDNVPLADAYKEDLRQVYNSGKQLLHVINDILDLARVDAGKLEMVPIALDVQPIIDAVLSTSRGLIATKPVQIRKNLPDEIPLVWADEARLRQVLLNLYSNACKYTDQGAITLTVTVRTESKELEFSVQDTGVGIAPEYQASIFEEFEQVRETRHDPRAGAGLGLPITRQLLTLMGGRIWMDSTPGEGSTFSFTVPLYDGQELLHNAPEQERAAAAT